MRHHLLKTALVVVLAGLFVLPAHAAIQFSGTSFSTTINTTGVKQDLINSIETALLNGGAGWTTISGSTTTNLLMQSGTTPQGLQIRCRIKDNGGSGIQLYLENVAGTLTDTETANFGATLMATAGRTYRVIGSTYQFIIYQAGQNRALAWVGMPFLPSFLSTVTNCGWLVSNAGTDVDTTIRGGVVSGTSFAGTSGTSAANWEVMVNVTYWANGNNGAANGANAKTGAPRFILNGVASDLGQLITTATGYRWGDDSVVTGDVYLAWGLTDVNAEAKVRGQVWDAIFIADAVGVNTTAVFSAHTFQNVTNTFAGAVSVAPRGGFWFAIN